MDSANRKIEELQKIAQAMDDAWRQQGAARRWFGSLIPRVLSIADDDSDLDDEPDALIGAKLAPRRPLGGSAIALPEPDEELMMVAVSTPAHCARR